MRSSKEELPVTIDEDGVIYRETTWGAMHVEIDTFHKEFDVTPFFKGLPDTMDPVPHWGYLLKGSFRVKYKDREEVINAGDVFYLPPGNTVIFEAGTEFVLFTPEEQLKKAAPIVQRNFATMQ